MQTFSSRLSARDHLVDGACTRPSPHTPEFSAIITVHDNGSPWTGRSLERILSGVPFRRPSKEASRAEFLSRNVFRRNKRSLKLKVTTKIFKRNLFFQKRQAVTMRSMSSVCSRQPFRRVSAALGVQAEPLESGFSFPKSTISSAISRF